jgi:hypothetical protein
MKKASLLLTAVALMALMFTPVALAQHGHPAGMQMGGGAADASDATATATATRPVYRSGVPTPDNLYVPRQSRSP